MKPQAGRRSEQANRRPRGRPTEDLNARESLLKAAVNQFAVHGLEGISVREIAEKAGVSLPTAYHYFGSKLALYEAAILYRHGVEEHRLSEALAAVASIEDMREWLNILVDVTHDEPDFHRLVFREVLRGDDSIIVEMARNYFEPLYRELCTKLDVFRPGLGDGGLAFALLSACIGRMAIQPFKHAATHRPIDADDESDRRALSGLLFDLFLGQIGARSDERAQRPRRSSAVRETFKRSRSK